MSHLSKDRGVTAVTQRWRGYTGTWGAGGPTDGRGGAHPNGDVCGCHTGGGCSWHRVEPRMLLHHPCSRAWTVPSEDVSRPGGRPRSRDRPRFIPIWPSLRALSQRSLLLLTASVEGRLSSDLCCCLSPPICSVLPPNRAQDKDIWVVPPAPPTNSPTREARRAGGPGGQAQRGEGRAATRPAGKLTRASASRGLSPQLGLGAPLLSPSSVSLFTECPPKWGTRPYLTY